MTQHQKGIFVVLRQFQGFLKPYTRQFWVAVGASIINKVLDLMPPLLVGWVIACLSSQTPPWMLWVMPQQKKLTLALFLASLAVVIFAVESLSQWLCDAGFMRLAQHMQHDLRMACYQKIQGREMFFFERNRLGETMTLLNDDVNQLERFLYSGFNDVLQMITLVFFAGYVLFSTSWQLALIGMAPIPIIIYSGIQFQKYIAPRYLKVREAAAKVATRIENNLSGIVVVKSFTAEQFETERVAQVSRAYRDTNKAAIALSTVFVPLIRLAVAIGFAAVLAVGSYWVLSKNGTLTVAQLVVFSMMIQRLLWPFTRLGQTLDNFSRAMASARRTLQLLNTPSTITDSPKPQQRSVFSGRIVFKDVQFCYQKDVPVLRRLNLVIEPGQTIGIVGQTGSGKSTLIKLLLRLYEVNSGCVYLDDLPIDQLTLQTLRQQIALVSQDVYLFQGSIYENIAYGMPQSTPAQVRQAAATAQLHGFIEQLPQGYDSLVGERGIQLSGGQRQRLSLARALLKDAPILVLDEATSAVDTETERLIQSKLNVITAGKTAVVIAHRLSTIRHADCIYVLDHGSITEHGTHEQLLSSQGIYADLWSVQSGF